MEDSQATVMSASELVVGYAKKALLPPISFAVEQGQTWAIAGPNGSGKSTLLRTLLGLLPPVSGNYMAPERIGYVPQRSLLDGRLPGRVIDVVASGLDEGFSFLRPGHVRSGRDAVTRALELTRCSDLERQRFSELSEGQKQRVLIARAVVRSPRLLVLDEPTSAMDISAEHRVMHLLDDIRNDAGIAVLLVSHHLAVVSEFATHLAVLDRDLGSVVTGAIDEAGADPIVQKRYGRLFVDSERHSASHFAVEEPADG
jgi:zinc transport system ATP-binding protein